MTIRAFVVNGIIKLQIGRFSKRLSPEVVKKGLDIYKTYETITSFPLLYFTSQHQIPENVPEPVGLCYRLMAQL